MIALVASVFGAALLGSAHCAAMCGGLACFVSGATGGDRRATAAYNGARLAAYATLGLLAGAAGAGFDRAGAISGLARPAAIVAGSLMILWGGASALAAAGFRVPVLAPPSFARDALGVAMRAVGARSSAMRGLVLGALTPLLPCGWLYAFVATAAATGSPLRGALTMTAFWLGTVPAMAAIGLGAQRFFGAARGRLPALTAAALVVIGVLTVAGKFDPAPHPHPALPATIAAPDGGHHR